MTATVIVIKRELEEEGLDPMREGGADQTPNGRRVEFARTNIIASCTNRLMIGYLPVYNRNYADEGRYVQIMFDTGSDSSFIDKNLAKQMNLKEIGDEVSVRTTGFGGNQRVQECEHVAVYFNTGKKDYLKVDLYTTEKITDPVINPPLDEIDEDFMWDRRILRNER